MHQRGTHKRSDNRQDSNIPRGCNASACGPTRFQRPHGRILHQRVAKGAALRAQCMRINVRRTLHAAAVALLLTGSVSAAQSPPLGLKLPLESYPPEIRKDVAAAYENAR